MRTIGVAALQAAHRGVNGTGVKSGVLCGRVVDREGHPIPDAEIGAPDATRRRGESLVRVAADGTFEVPGFADGSSARTIVVHLHRDPAQCPRAEFSVVPGAPAADLVLGGR